MRICESFIQLDSSLKHFESSFMILAQTVAVPNSTPAIRIANTVITEENPSQRKNSAVFRF